MSKTKKPEASKKVCLRDGCGKFVRCRGLCLTDYRMAATLVQRGEQTWERLESLGCCLPRQPRGRGRHSFMSVWIQSKSAKKS